MSVWNNKEALDKLEQLRVAKRKTGRLTFDCVNAMLRGDRIFCTKLHLLGQARDGSMSLMSVLRGMTSGTCKNCEDYSSEEEDNESS